MVVRIKRAEFSQTPSKFLTYSQQGSNTCMTDAMLCHPALPFGTRAPIVSATGGGGAEDGLLLAHGWVPS